MNTYPEKNYEVENEPQETIFDGLSGVFAKIIFNEKIDINKKIRLLTSLSVFIREIESSGIELEGAEKALLCSLNL